MKTKPRGIHATFTTSCATCGNDLNVTDGRVDPHNCERLQQPISLADIRAALRSPDA